MKEWFEKYPIPEKVYTDKHALKLIHKKIHCARKYFLEEDYENEVKALKEAHDMIADLLELKERDKTPIVVRVPHHTPNIPTLRPH